MGEKSINFLIQTEYARAQGCAASQVTAPTEWNKLPQALRTVEIISGFRKQLKIYISSD